MNTNVFLCYVICSMLNKFLFGDFLCYGYKATVIQHVIKYLITVKSNA